LPPPSAIIARETDKRPQARGDRDDHAGQQQPKGELDGTSLAVASRLYDLANIALVLSLIVGVISTALLVRMGNIKERHLQRELAGAGAAAAEANARAAEANLALAKFRAPRALTEAQAAMLVTAMAPFKGQSVSTGAIPPNHEGLSFAVQLMQVLQTAGLNANVNQGAAEHHLGPVHGVVAMTTTGNAKGERLAATLARTLTELGIPAQWTGGYMENVMREQEKTNPDVRKTEYHQWVIVVVGDKP
jgi:hypothetical protein